MMNNKQTVCGLRYRCKICLNHDFCAKCYSSINIIHARDHIFDEEGPEFEQEFKKAEKDVDDDENSDAGDRDDETGEGGSKKKEKEEEEKEKIEGENVVEDETNADAAAVEEEGEPAIVTEAGNEASTDGSDSVDEDTEASE